jgi:hypothetical protein
VNAAEKATKDAEAKAEAGRRATEVAKKEGIAAASKATYKADMEKYSKKDAKAKQADADFAKSKARSAADAKLQAQATDKALAAAAAQHECATDGSECQSCNTATNKCSCKKLDAAKKIFMGADLVSCSDTPTKSSYAGEHWAGVPAPAPLAPNLPVDAAKCNAAKAKVAPAFAQKAKCPCEFIACGKMKWEAKKAALHNVLDAGTWCEQYCFPGTATKTNDGVADSHGICIDQIVYKQLAQQLDDLPNYKAMGTNDKIKAGPKADLCRMVKNTLCGALGGAGIHDCPPVDTAVPFKARGQKIE